MNEALLFWALLGVCLIPAESLAYIDPRGGSIWQEILLAALLGFLFVLLKRRGMLKRGGHRKRPENKRDP